MRRERSRRFVLLLNDDFTSEDKFALPPPRFPTVVHDILSVLVVTVVIASPLVLTNRCGRTKKDTTRKDHEKYLSSLK